MDELLVPFETPLWLATTALFVLSLIAPAMIFEAASTTTVQ